MARTARDHIRCQTISLQTCKTIRASAARVTGNA